MADPERLLTSSEVAMVFRVDAKTVGRWATNGWLRFLSTPGGHRRFRESDVAALLESSTHSADGAHPDFHAHGTEIP